MISRPLAESEKPRLLVLTSTYPRWPDDPEPGFVHELTRRLVEKFDVTVICPAAPGVLPCEVMDGVLVRRFRYAPASLQTLVNGGGITTNLKIHRWKFILVPFFLIAMFWSTITALRSWRPAVVHAHWLVPQGLIATLACRSLLVRPRLVVTSHGADLYAWKGWPFDTLKRWVARNASKLTVVSHAMMSEAVGLASNRCSIEVAPMGVDLVGSFNPDFKRHRVRGEILFVGRLVEKKGLRVLIEALPAILLENPQAVLLIAGFGPEESRLRDQVKKLNLDSSVRFIGPISQVELVDLYRRAAVFVAPFISAESGDREGLGLVSIEAAGCGCPVVVSDIPAVNDIFGPGEAILVEPGNAEALAIGVIAALNGTQHCNPSLNILREKFDWSSVAERYSQILRPCKGS